MDGKMDARARSTGTRRLEQRPPGSSSSQVDVLEGGGLELGDRSVPRSASMFTQSAEGGEGRTTTLSIEGGGAAGKRRRQQYQLNQLDECYVVRRNRGD